MWECPVLIPVPVPPEVDATRRKWVLVVSTTSERHDVEDSVHYFIGKIFVLHGDHWYLREGLRAT